MIGTTVLHYRIIEKLGEGGMGVVYKAEDTKLHRNVALKFLPPHVIAKEVNRSRFLQEARSAAVLNHPNICTIYGIYDEGDKPFIEMEFVDGMTVRETVATGSMQITDCIRYAIQIGEALQEAHSKGIVHRDIKADNIMINAKGQVKVMDFGLAKIKGSLKLTRTSSILGTLGYMAPEQIQGGEVDARSDIFAFGVVLFEMLTGRLPFRGDHEPAMMYSILNEQPELLAKYRSDTSEELQRIISRSLEKDPEDRYQSAADMVSEIRRLQKKTGQVSRAYQIPLATAPVSQPVTKPASSKRLLYAGAAALIVLALVASYFAFRGNGVVDKKSIAVLPFKNQNTDEESEFFSDGITEDIINQLSKIRELRVMARPAVMRYKKTDKSLRDIGRELNVSTLLMGSVRRVGNQVRISAELIDASTEQQLWGEAYDKTMTQIFEIQGAVAQQIATTLQANLTTEEKKSVSKQQTGNAQAYTYYLRGREYYYRYRRDANENAIALFKKALQLDPNYALAYAGLGDAYGQRVQRFGFLSIWLDSALVEAKKSIKLDPDLAEGHKAIGLAYNTMGKFSMALDYFKKAASLNPNYFPAVANIGSILQSLGKPDEALPWVKKAMVINPSAAVNLNMLAELYQSLDDLPRAREFADRTIVLQPDLQTAYFVLLSLDAFEGKADEAKKRCQQVLSMFPNEAFPLGVSGFVCFWLRDFNSATPLLEKELKLTAPESDSYNPLAYIYLRTGRKQEADKLLNQSIAQQHKYIDKGDEGPGSRFSIATSYAIQGKDEEALRWFQEALDRGFIDWRLITGHPAYDHLRTNARFKQLLDDLKSKIDRMRKHAEELDRQ